MLLTYREPVCGATSPHAPLPPSSWDCSLDYELNKRLLELHAAEGWAAFVEVKTGKIRAISNLRRDGDHCVEDYNHLFEDLVDPGSTFKTVSYMILLEDGKIKPTDEIDTGNYPNATSEWNYRGQKIHDDHRSTGARRVCARI